MPVDTRNKRASVLGFLKPPGAVFPNPDGSLATQDDRQHVAYSYPGILSSAFQDISFFDHFTSFNTDRWKVVKSAAATVGVTDSTLEFNSPATSDHAFVYYAAPIDKTKNQLWAVCYSWDDLATAANRWWGFSVIQADPGPVAAAAAATRGGASGDLRIRISPQVAATVLGLGVERWDSAGARTKWLSTDVWGATTGAPHCQPIDGSGYFIFGIETRTSPSQSWRAFALTSDVPAAYAFDQGLVMEVLTDWVDWTFHASTSKIWMCLGDNINDAQSGTNRVEWVRYRTDETRQNAWVNARDTLAGTWVINHWYSYDGDFFLPEDRTTISVDVGGGGAWDEQFTKDKTVIKDGSTFYMYYAGSRVSDGKWGIGLATNTLDPPTGVWIKDVNNPFIPAGLSTHEDQNFAPFIVKDEDDPDSAKRWKLFYAGFNTTTSTWRIFCRYASSPTSTTWTLLSGPGTGGSLIDAGGAGDFDERGCSNPVVFFNNGQWEIWYAGQGPGTGNQWSVGRASGTSLTALTKDTVNNPYIPKTADAKEDLSGAISGRTWPIASNTGFQPDAMVHIDDTSLPSGNDYGISRIRKVNAGDLEVYHPLTGFTTGNSAHIRQIDAGVVTIHAIRFNAVTSKWEFYVTPFDLFNGHTFNHAYSERTGKLTSTNLLDKPKDWDWLTTPPIPVSFRGRRSNENMALVNLPTFTGVGATILVQERQKQRRVFSRIFSRVN